MDPELPLKRPTVWKYVGGLMPVIVVWAILVAWLATLIADRASWSEQTDEAAMREWLDETRVFRKTLPELVRDYSESNQDNTRERKREELEEHVRALVEPTRIYSNQLPLFPEVFRIQVTLAPGDIITWESHLPRPKRKTDGQVREFSYVLSGMPSDGPRILCEYRVHAFNRLQQRETDRRQTLLLAEALLVASTLLAAMFVYRFLTRERKREVARLAASAQAKRKEAELLQTRLDRDEAELKQAELAKQLLRQERAVADARSQLYAGIGVMAGSYAHNIKNLLVRPNDLLARCIEVNGLSLDQQSMLGEVKSTLGTVTERLQQILRTVQRDPNTTEATTRVNLAKLVKGALTTWAPLARDKWKVGMKADVSANEIWVVGDESHLQQTLENLIFNARDATFEMRNALRDDVRAEANVDTETRKSKLIAAAAWRGEIAIHLKQEANAVILEVADNGIGMAEDVRARCLETHFSTKRNNALYQGHAAGMGLGLSFVAMVLHHHSATLTITSAPRTGATFRVSFPAASDLVSTPADGKTPA